MATNNEVREILYCQMKALHERSTERGIPLIALDGLSGRIAMLGKILLDDAGAAAADGRTEAGPESEGC